METDVDKLDDYSSVIQVIEKKEIIKKRNQRKCKEEYFDNWFTSTFVKRFIILKHLI